MQKKLLWLLLLLLVFSGVSAYAESTVEQIDIGYYDCWLRSDGVTWLDNIHPGSTVVHEPTITYADPSKVIGVKSVEFYPDTDIGEFYKYAVDNGQMLDYEYLGNGQVSFKLQSTLTDNSGLGGEIKTQWWQAELVEGKRFYLPVKITWILDTSTIEVEYQDKTTGQAIQNMDIMTVEPGTHEITVPFIGGYAFESWTLNGGSIRTDQPVNVVVSEVGSADKVVLQYQKAAAYLVVTGDGNPNPVELSGGVAYHDSEITATIYGLVDDTPSTWFFRQTVKGESNWLSDTVSSANTTVKSTFANLEVSADTTYSFEITMTTEKGIVYTAVGEYTEFVAEPQTGSITPILSVENLDGKIEVTETEIQANKPITALFEFDATESTAELGIDEINYYWRADGEEVWNYSGWMSPQIWETDVTAHAGKMDSNKEIEVDCRVMVKDSTGAIKYGHADDLIKFDVHMVPGIIELQGKNVYYPLSISDVTGSDINRLTVDYTHPDGVAHDYTIFKKYQVIGETETLVDTVTSNNLYYDIEGNPNDVYRVSAVSYDVKGQATNEDSELCIISDGLPSCTVLVTEDQDDSEQLNIEVTDTTPSAVKSLFPNSWDGYLIYDKDGNTLLTGPGKLPDDIMKDDRFYGNVAGFKQWIKNALGNNSGIDFYIMGSVVDFELDPPVLFETELVTVTDLSKSITNKEWNISERSAYEFSTLTFDLQNQFTRNAGEYDVKLSGTGIFSSMYYEVLYSNNYNDLLTLPTLTSADIQAKHNESAVLSYESQNWTTGIESSNYNYSGNSYKYRRIYSYIVTDEVQRELILPVIFKDATPVADFEVTGTLKMLRTLTFDGSNSTNVTDAELQAAYPILFSNELTEIRIMPVYGDQSYDSTRSDQVVGEGSVTDGVYTYFVGKENQDLIFKREGYYKVEYKVFNGLKESEWKSKLISIQIDHVPFVEVTLDKYVTHRDPDDNLDSTFMAIATYYSIDDAISLSESYFDISFDANNNSNFTDDGLFSGMKIYRDSDTVPKTFIVSPTFNNGVATVQVKTNSTLKNFLGSIKCDFVVVEEWQPAEPGVPLQSDSFKQPNDEKIVMIENLRPTVTLDTGRIPTIEYYWYSHESVKDSELIDLDLVLEQHAQDRIKLIIHHDRHGVITDYDNFDYFDE